MVKLMSKPSANRVDLYYNDMFGLGVSIT